MQSAILFVVCFFGLIAVAFLLVFRACEGRWPHCVVPEEVDPLLDEMVALIEASLRDAPLEWASNGYTVTNAQRRISIWTANGEDSIGIKLDGASASPRDGSFPGPLKKRLWRAVNIRNVAAVVDRFRDAA